MPLLSVIIPCYNERATVAEIVRRVREVEPTAELVLVDDGSTDGTRDVLRTMCADDPPGLKVIFHERNRGKGAAIHTGVEATTGEIILIQDADLEYDPRDYPALLRPIQEGRADVVYGSRFLGGPRKAMMFWHTVGHGNGLQGVSLTRHQGHSAARPAFRLRT
jgi:glycosyltransferase involved in cell wall biosynthesis